MRIITRKRLRDYASQHPDAAASLDHWEHTVRHAAWASPADLKRSFNDVDPVRIQSGNSVYVFNIAGNRHRLVAAIHFNAHAVFVLRLMTHRDYDNPNWKASL